MRTGAAGMREGSDPRTGTGRTGGSRVRGRDASTPVGRPDAPRRQGRAYFDIAAALAALDGGQPVAFPPFELVHWGGLTFALNYRHDPVQNEIRQGRFYEADELEALAALLPPGAVCVDVGSNIGNHALFFAARMGAARVIVVEPNPLAAAPLLANVVMNRLGGVICTDLLGIGFGARSEDGFAMRRHDRNLGATRMQRAAGAGPLMQQGLAVHAGDDLLEGEHPDLIKIDVEGMEMEVLAGLSRTIARSRPLVLIEIDRDNDPAFAAWLAENGYERLRQWPVGGRRSNHLIRPLAGAVTDGLTIGKEDEPC